MTAASWETAAVRERLRLLEQHHRYAHRVEPDLYAPWQPHEILARAGRKRVAAAMMRQEAVLPAAGQRCLEVGCGRLGWLSDLIEWGLRETDLSGVDLDADRIVVARARLPAADLREVDATDLPWEAATFRLVVFSTVFSSILDPAVRARAAAEAWRVLAPGGAVLVYDLATRSRSNPNVAPLSAKAIASLFPKGTIRVRKVTLAPIIARAVAGRSWLTAVTLESVPWLRTHVLALLVKRSD